VVGIRTFGPISMLDAITLSIARLSKSHFSCRLGAMAWMQWP
jgi:hypothetical protein